MFGTDLTKDYAAACSFGLEPSDFYAAGLEGALCDATTLSSLREVEHEFEWESVSPADVEVT